MGRVTVNAVATLQLREIAEARAAGEEFFMDLPDSWYEPRPTYGCENGHVSHAYLASEVRGKLCLACHKRIYLLPGHYSSDEKLTQALNAIKAEVAHG